MKFNNSIKHTIIIMSLLLYFASQALADDSQSSKQRIYKQLVETSLQQFENSDRKNWSFTVHRMENEEGNITSRIERYKPNPDKSKQWTLIRSNNQQPTPKQQAEFVKSRAEIEKSKQDGDNNLAFNLRDLINQESLILQNETDTHHQLNFDVHIEKLGEDAKGKLDGVLTYNKQLKFIDSIEITNNSDFSPMFSADISSFKITMKFHKLADSILPLENTMDMKGTFAFFTEIDETSIDTFSDFSYQKTTNHLKLSPNIANDK